MKYLNILILTVVALAGCGAVGGGTSPPGGTVAGVSAERAVFATKTAYEAALTAAVAYKNLPVCATPAKPPCSNPAIVTQLRKADNVAAGALDAAEAAVRTPSIGTTARDQAVNAANAALAALQAVLTTTGATP